MTTPQPDTPATPSPGGTGRPEPVLGAAAAASALTSLAGLVLLVLVFTHVITPEGQAVLGPALASAIPAVVGAVGTLAAAWHARRSTLPLADPRVAAAWEQIMAAEQRVQSAAAVARRPGPQTPGVGDHAAPEDTGPTGG